MNAENIEIKSKMNAENIEIKSKMNAENIAMSVSTVNNKDIRETLFDIVVRIFTIHFEHISEHHVANSSFFS